MSFDADKLYALLPAIYRVRDAEQGQPLRALLDVIAGQVGLVQDNLEQLYDDQFIETCAEWVIPYIGDLIGYRELHGVAPNVVSPRAEVGHTISFRRRKGTAAMLEQLARDVTGWDARVVEYFLLLGWTQYMNHVRPNAWYAPDLRRWEDLERLNTPFEKSARTVDVRQISLGGGKYNIPNIGIFLWRLADYRLTDSRAFPVDARRWRFHPLNLDAPLYTRSVPANEITHLADPINVPLPISRRVLETYLDQYYGEELSIWIKIDNVPIPSAQICSCDLSDIAGGKWAHLPDKLVAVDPVLGRIAFPKSMKPKQVTVRFCYGFSADLGGGEYDRSATFDPKLNPLSKVHSPALLQPALTAALAALPALPSGVIGGFVSIEDSGRFDEVLSPLTLPAGKHFELRAVNLRRPTLLHGGDHPTSGDWILQGTSDPTLTPPTGAGSTLILNGLILDGHTLRVPAAGNFLTKLILRHCTLRPTTGPSLIVESGSIQVEIDHCIVGGLRVSADAQVSIADSIVDAGAETAIAYAAPAGAANAPGGAVQIERCTVIGQVHTRELQLASNSILLAALSAGDTWTAPVSSVKKQQGCVRFSYVPLSAIVPRRFRCQPVDGVEDALRVRPQFTSLRYGDPGYGQLSQRCALEIRQGAHDEAEMGAFHDLFQPQRETNIRVRLKEYLRFRLEAGIFDAT